MHLITYSVWFPGAFLFLEWDSLLSYEAYDSFAYGRARGGKPGRRSEEEKKKKHEIQRIMPKVDNSHCAAPRRAGD